MKNSFLNKTICLVFALLPILISCKNKPTGTPPEGYRLQDTCYICPGTFAKAYHAYHDCAALRQCTKGIATTTIEDAIADGRRPCHKCY